MEGPTDNNKLNLNCYNQKIFDQTMATERGDMIVEAVSLSELPERCLAKIMSFTTPKDVCRFSAVSHMFLSAAVSDVVWQRFLPNDLESILSTASDGYHLLASSSSKKEVYFRLCDNPIIVDHGRKSFTLEKKSGKKCYMLSARDLLITWGDTPQYWTWNSNPTSRFAEVAELIRVSWLEICGKINTCLLSPLTLYTAHLVFKFSARTNRLDDQPIEVTMTLDGGKCGAQIVSWREESKHRNRASVTIGNVHYPKEREDGWLEMEFGDVLCREGEDGELEMRLFEDNCYRKGGLIVEGIDIRPKDVSREASPCS